MAVKRTCVTLVSPGTESRSDDPVVGLGLRLVLGFGLVLGSGYVLVIEGSGNLALVSASANTEIRVGSL